MFLTLNISYFHQLLILFALKYLMSNYVYLDIKNYQSLNDEQGKPFIFNLIDYLNNKFKSSRLLCDGSDFVFKNLIKST